MTEQKSKENASFFKIFLIFAKIGAFTIGGGYAMIPLIQNEMVKRGWLDEKEFPDLIALSQAAPGILAVNISIFVGYKLRGTKGSIVATLGSILPSFLIILAIAMAFTGYQDEGRREGKWFKQKVISYHRKVSSIISTLSFNGFFVEKVVEPVPNEDLLMEFASLERDLIRPTFLIVRARKVPFSAH